MSEAAPHVPFTETKAPESAERLHRGALGLVDIAASTMANFLGNLALPFYYRRYRPQEFSVVKHLILPVLVRRDPGVGERVGSIVADE